MSWQQDWGQKPWGQKQWGGEQKSWAGEQKSWGGEQKKSWGNGQTWGKGGDAKASTSTPQATAGKGGKNGAGQSTSGIVLPGKGAAATATKAPAATKAATPAAAKATASKAATPAAAAWKDTSKAAANQAPKGGKAAAPAAAAKAAAGQAAPAVPPLVLEAVKQAREALKALETSARAVTDINKRVRLDSASSEELGSVELAAQPALKGIATVMSQLGKTASCKDTNTVAEVTKLKNRTQELQKTVQEILTKFKTKKNDLNLQTWIKEGTEKAEAIEKAIEGCKDAEGPFLMGMEVLPEDESGVAIEACEKAGSAASKAVNEARFLRQKSKEVKAMGNDAVQKLAPLLARLEAAEKRVNAFNKETADRKLSSIIASSIQAVKDCEKKADQLQNVTKILSSSTLEEMSSEKIEAAIEKSRAAQTEAEGACSTAKAAVSSKQRAAKAPKDAGPIVKLQGRIASAREKISKARADISAAEKVLKSRHALESEAPKLEAVEATVAKVVKKLPKSDDASLSEQLVTFMDETLAEAVAALTPVAILLQSCAAEVPPKTKASLDELLARKNEINQSISKIKTDTKARREDVVAGVVTRDGTTLMDAAEKALSGLAAPEDSFLKGIEKSLPETMKLLEASEAAAKDVSDALNKGRSFIGEMMMKTKGFGEAPAKKVKEASTGFNDRLGAVAKRLATFKSDTAERTKVAKLREAEANVKELEDVAMKATESAVEPLAKEGAESMSLEESAAPLEKFLTAEKEALKLVAQLNRDLSSRQIEAKEDKDRSEKVTKLKEKVAEIQSRLTEVRKPIVFFEKRDLASRLVKESKEAAATLDGEVAKATAACAPLLEHGGKEFLVHASKQILSKALAAHMREKELVEDALFKEIGGGKAIKKAAFSKYVESLPTTIGHEEINFPAERRDELFKLLDVDADGALNKTEFTALFRTASKCIKATTVTDSFSVDEGQTVCKVEPGDKLETIGLQKEGEKGLVRVECLMDGKTGWVTIRQGNNYFVQNFNAYSEFCSAMDKALNSSANTINNVSSALNKKIKICGKDAEGPLAESKKQITEIKQQVWGLSSSVDALWKKAAEAKKALTATEKSEANAHIDAKNRKEAEEYVNPAMAAADSAAAAAKAVTEAAAPFTSSEADEVAKFQKPSELRSKVRALLSECAAKASEAKQAAMEQLKVVNKVSPATGGTAEAKRQLAAMMSTADAGHRAAKKALESVDKNCKVLVAKLFDDVVAALRKDMAGATPEAYFGKLAKGSNVIKAADFCKKLESTCSVSHEQALLLSERVQPGDISLHAFLSAFQCFYIVLKEIALTDAFDIDAGKALRKAAKDELVEVLEGPKVDEKHGMTRIRLKSIAFGDEGWMTVKGTEGTPYLQILAKPFFSCTKSVKMTKDKPQSSAIVRNLDRDEAVEILEGPFVEAGPDVMRAKVKLTKDGKVGWVTTQDANGGSSVDTSSVLKIKTTVAMTDGEDLKTCKVIRTLLADEIFHTSSEPVEDSATTMVRAHGKTDKDSVEGWVTIRGNAGTIYAEVTTTCSVAKDELQLQSAASPSGAGRVRTIAKGEKFSITEGPKAEKSPDQERFLVRALRDGTTGWVSRVPGDTGKWSSTYRLSCRQKANVYKAQDSEEVLREALRGETFEFMEGPVAVGEETRIRVRAAVDGTDGWVVMRDAAGKKQLECV